MAQQINLFNPLFLEQKKYFSASAMLQGIALLLAGLVVLAMIASRQTAGLERLLVQVQGQSAQQREGLVALSRQYSQQGTSRQLEQELTTTEERLRRRSELLAEMSTGIGANVQGYSPHLSALARRTAEGVWLTGIEFGGKASEMVLKGRALNADLVPAYVRSLRQEPLFAGRTLRSLQVTARETAPGATPSADAAPATPPRYVEFVLSIPLAEADGRAVQ